MDELFAGEELDQLRQRSLRRGILLIKRRRQWRVFGRLCVMVLPPVLLALAVWTKTSSSEGGAPKSTPLTVQSPAQPASKVRLINDDELFALFPNRALAIIGSPGHQKLVFLDQRNGVNQ